MVRTTDHVSPADQDTPANEAKAGAQEEDEHRGFMDKMRHPFHDLEQKMKDSRLHDMKVKATHLKHKIGKFENLFNSNHRHDEEHEQKTDAKRTNISEAHRFKSFAPERDGNLIKWYVDGRDYFHAVSVALERAKETIYIEDWWLSPELFLRRPPYFNQEWRLDQCLKRAAERGVKIYVVLYREVEYALTCNSAHSKHVLEGLCPEGTKGHGNIRVMRHPDHNVFENASDMTFYWAHHEKFIVIDYDLAFIGGLDLCFGRWDVKQHPLADAHPAGVENEIWPGQDFNNNRIMDFQNVSDWKSNEVSKTEYGRMPWHDVAMGLIGPCVYDIAEHFVLRWNFVKRDKYKRTDGYDWLTMTGRTDEDEDLIGVQRPKHPVGDYIHHPLTPLDTKLGNPNQNLDHSSLQPPRPEPSRMNTPVRPEIFHDAQEQIDEHGYTNEQHRLGHGIPKRLGHHDARPHIHRDKTLPELPREGQDHHEGEAPKQEGLPVPSGNKAQKQGPNSNSGGLEERRKGYSSNVVASGDQSSVVRAQGTIHAQIVRSSADWSSGILAEQSIQNAYCQVIREAKHFVYIENQFFITATGENQAPIHNQIGGAIADACIRAGKEGRKFRVIIVIPSIPGFAGDLRDDAATGTRAIMDYQYKSINRGPESIFGKIKAAGVDPNEHVFVFNLRSYDRINLTPGLKKQEDKSGVKYQEVQRAHAEEVMASGIHGAANAGSSSNANDDSAGQQEREQANDKRRQFEEKRHEAGLNNDDGSAASGGAAEGKDGGVQSRDSIAQNAMLGEKRVSDEEYAGRGSGTGNLDNDDEMREQEMENFVHEELYIHSKVSLSCRAGNADEG